MENRISDTQEYVVSETQQEHQFSDKFPIIKILFGRIQDRFTGQINDVICITSLLIIISKLRYDHEQNDDRDRESFLP